MKNDYRLRRGMGIGGWLTNYKRFNVLPRDRRMTLTVGDMEHFESYITERDVAYIASLGMDHVRLGFDQIVLESAPYEYRAEIIAILHRFVGWCRKYDLGVVLNMHKARGNYCDILEERGLFTDPELKARFIALWLMLEDEFAGDPDVTFELLNEVVNATADDWNCLADATLTAIRSKNKERRIIIGSASWGSMAALHDLKIFDDDNVVYTFHFYTPAEFTHQRGVLQADHLYYNRDMPYPCDDIERYRDFHRVVNGKENHYPHLSRMDIQHLRGSMAPVKAWIEAHPDKTLWCGEFGTIRHARIEWREAWMRDVISLFGELGVSYCVWNYLSTPNDGNRFSLVDDDTRLILSERMAKIIRGDTL